MSEATAPKETRAHVVVVDDDEELCELLLLRLEHHGFRASAEHNVRGGLEVLERDTVDVMIVDLRLENESGLDLLSEVLKRSADLPVIMLTAHGTIETAVEAMARGAFGFLTKPFDDRELLQKVRHAVERGRLSREVAGLRRIIGTAGPNRLLGTSDALSEVRDLLARVAPTNASVLLLGESGTGKELAARSLHELSPRHDEPFVSVNCASLPGELLDQQLFGSAKDDGASALLAQADRGTLLLDAIDEASLDVQAKLLRLLEGRTYLSPGSGTPRTVDVRVVTTCSRDLRAAVAAGRFREDLFYLLHVVPILLPPLRERREDIPVLADVFLSRAAARYGLRSPQLTSEALRLLMAHSFPGNVRELAHVVEGAAILSVDGRLLPEHVLSVLPRQGGAAAGVSSSEPAAGAADLPIQARGADGELRTLREAREAFDRRYLEEALVRSGGNVSAAAKLAGRNRTDFHELLRRHEINSSDFREGGSRQGGGSGESS
ncbi:MAG TPA: sigma-54 dependent transcriptional regulator [Polyangiaceae bacterium]|nr:sigma-54 dependent transcriptional regulator [Polyangiaceae bacterium]